MNYYNDLKGFKQCHFFAGIGGWSYALRLARWPNDREVWTGSCPCQPLSCAGQRKGDADERHLWPAFYRLIEECRPATVFGEQVASKDGREWMSGVRADLEGSGYALGCADLCAASVGAPHRRQRLYWVADSCGERHRGCEAIGREEERRIEHTGNGSVADATDRGYGIERDGETRGREFGGNGEPGKLADSEREGLEGHVGDVGDGSESGRIGEESIGSVAEGCGTLQLGDTESGGCGVERDASRAGSGGHAEFAIWSRFEIVQCRDGKARRFEPESFEVVDGIPYLLDALRDAGVPENEIKTAIQTFPLSEGVSGRVALLRGYGNAIVPQVAATFLEAYLTI